MAEANDCFNVFNVGSIVSCKTCFNEDVQGEVLAYDPTINTILLSPNVRVFRYMLSKYRESCQILVYLSNRVKKSIEEKSKLMQAMEMGGTVEGQKLFHAIKKTIEEISWLGSSILIMNQVIISPPYLLDNVTEYKEAKENNAKAVAHVRKIVEKFYKDQQKLSLNNGTPSPQASSANIAASAIAPTKTTPATPVSPSTSSSSPKKTSSASNGSSSSSTSSSTSSAIARDSNPHHNSHLTNSQLKTIAQ
ncbi:Protein LSM12-like protein B [Armadillidium vulgare]|nr:Protein LSM12-like protein B [Armadillidium vulgare]